MKKKPEKRKFTDEKGRAYTTTKVIGEGGQGTVLEVEGGKFAIKLLKKANALAHVQLARRMKFIKQMNIQDLPLARPLALLQQPSLGYVMEMATGMCPLSTLVLSPQGSSLSEWYLATGGLRRRVALLTRIAETFAELHARGICYGDLSPMNVFISDDTQFTEIFLIDLDNLRQTICGDEFIFTPGYGAPEVVNQIAGISSLSDLYSFAVIAYQVLCVTHPFIGDYVNEGEPELEEQAYQGEVPWVDHSSNSLNQRRTGIPSAIVCSQRMMELFARTFEDGLHSRSERPFMNEWKEVLQNALNAIVVCPNCKGSYFYDPSEVECRFCDAVKPDCYVGFLKQWEPITQFEEAADPKTSQFKVFNGKVQTQGKIIFGGEVATSINERHIHLASGEKGRKSIMEVKIEAKSAKFIAHCENYFLARDLTNEPKHLKKSVTMPLEQLDGAFLFFKPLSEPQRIISFKKLK